MNKTIGNILKEARRKQGLKLPDVSAKLCISKTYLRALEGNDKKNLPAQTFTIGFLRTYATHLGLDADEMVQKAKGATPEDVPTLEVNVPEKAHDSSMPSVMVLVALATGMTSLITGYSYFVDSEQESAIQFQPQAQELVANANFVVETTPSVTLKTLTPVVVETEPSEEIIETDVVEASVAPQEPEVAPKEKALLVNDVAEYVEIRATSDTWMMIVGDENNNVFDNIIHKGESYRAQVGKGLHLTTGNAGGLEFFHSGHQLTVPSGHGTILNALALDQVILEPEDNNSQQQELSP